MSKKSVNGSVADRIYDRALAIAKDQGLELIDIEYLKEAGEWYLRVYIDREQGVDHQCCGLYSEALGQYLDREDLIPNSYYLEISSPGIERPLKKEQDFLRFIGSTVALSLYSPLDGLKEYQGELLGFEDGQIIIRAAIPQNNKQKAKPDLEKELKIPFDQVGKAHLVAGF